jgi:hypothetical protein
MAAVAQAPEEQRAATPDPACAKVMELHRALMAEYSEVLQRASQPKPRKGSESRKFWRWELPKRPAPRPYGSRRLCESHVKRRLNVLASIYKQESLVGSDEAARAAYEQAAGESQSFADSLTFWRLPTWLALLPLFGGALSQVGGLMEGVELDDPFVLGWIGLWLLYFGGFAVAILVSNFHRKRTVLYPSWKADERLRGTVKEGPDDERNVYRSEEGLFDSLRRGRPLEQPLDFYAWTFVAAILAWGVTMTPFLADEDGSIAEWLYVFVPVMVLYGLVVGWLGLRLRKRRWR